MPNNHGRQNHDSTGGPGRSHATRYKKGVSGNPSGRPKGSRNLRSIVLEAARDEVTITIAGKSRKVSKVQATAMQLATKAASGDPRAMNKFFDWIDKFESRDAADKPAEYPFGPKDLEVLNAAYDRMKQCKQPKDGEQDDDSST